MKILLIDFESTGINTDIDRITEIGAMVVDEKWQPTGQQVSQLVWADDYPTLTPEVQKITGITPELIAEKAVTPQAAFTMLGELIDEDVKHVVAYNRGYDEALFKTEMQRHGLTFDPKMNWIFSSPWLCAMVDIAKNHELKSWKLMHVALDHMVPVDPNKLHRAIADVELMRQVLVASGETAETMYKFQNTNWVYIRALVKKPWEDNGVSSGEAKALGYTWEQAKGDETKRKFEKCWVKRIKENKFDEEVSKASFPVRMIGGL